MRVTIPYVQSTAVQLLPAWARVKSLRSTKPLHIYTNTSKYIGRSFLSFKNSTRPTRCGRLSPSTERDPHHVPTRLLWTNCIDPGELAAHTTNHNDNARLGRPVCLCRLRRDTAEQNKPLRKARNNNKNKPLRKARKNNKN